MNTTSNVTPISENPKQPQQRQTFKDIIAANVKSLIEQLEAGHSDALTAYLDAMSRFRSYSFGNVLEIARQKPDASRVAGMYAWNQLGRRVKKGEKGTLRCASRGGAVPSPAPLPNQKPQKTFPLLHLPLFSLAARRDVKCVAPNAPGPVQHSDYMPQTLCMEGASDLLRSSR